MTGLSFSLQAEPDARFAALVWDVFFQERGRGLSLAQHFPWLGKDADALYASLTEGHELVAGLVAKRIAGTTVAMVGLVCVRADRRGQGLGRQLLDQSLHALDERGFTAQTLWTGKPDVYRAQHFEVDDDGLLLTVDGWEPQVGTSLTTQSWPTSADLRGLPPYALSACVFQSADAQAIVLTDPRGSAVAQWLGADDAVAALLAACMPAHWRLHALVGDTLPAALRARGARIHTEHNALQMWRHSPGRPHSPHPVLRVLDRI